MLLLSHDDRIFALVPAPYDLVVWLRQEEQLLCRLSYLFHY